MIKKINKLFFAALFLAFAAPAHAQLTFGHVAPSTLPRPAPPPPSPGLVFGNAWGIAAPFGVPLAVPLSAPVPGPQGPAGPQGIQGIQGIPGLSGAGLAGISAKAPGGTITPAVGNGIADDASALNSQMLAASTLAGGSPLTNYLDPGLYKVTTPVIVGSRSAAEITGGIYGSRTGWRLIGTGNMAYQPDAANPQKGAVIQAGAAGMDAILATGDGAYIGNVLSNITLDGSTFNPAYGFHSSHLHWSNLLVEHCMVQNVGMPFCQDGTDGGNGEGLTVTNSVISGSAGWYKNASTSGQAFYSRFINNSGGVGNGGTQWIMGNGSGGLGLYAYGNGCTFSVGPLQNTFLLQNFAQGPLSFIGGREEQMDTLIKHNFTGSTNELGTVHIADMQFDGCNTYAAANGTTPFPFIQSASPTNGCQYLYIIENCNFYSVIGTNGHANPYLWVDIASDDNSRYTFRHCNFFGFSTPPGGKPPLTGGGTVGAHRGIVLEDCWQSAPGSFTLTAMN